MHLCCTMKKVRISSSGVMVTDRCYQTAAGVRNQTALIFDLRSVIRQGYFVSAVLLARMQLKKKYVSVTFLWDCGHTIVLAPPFPTVWILHTIDTADIFSRIMGVHCNRRRLHMKSVNKTVIACVALCHVTAIKGWSFFSSFMLTGKPYMLGSAFWQTNTAVIVTRWTQLSRGDTPLMEG